MPSSINNINLIRTKTSSSPQLDAIEGSLRRSSYIALGVFLCVGVTMALIYALFYFENQNLQQERSRLIIQINSQKSSEGLIIAIKDRTKTVEKVMTTQKPWTKTLDLVATFATPPLLSSVSVDEQNKVVLSVQTESLEDLLTMVNTIIAHTKENRIKSPQLLSFQIDKVGSVELTVSFTAVF